MKITVPLTSRNTQLSAHLLDQIRRRGIDGEDVERCIKYGRQTPGKISTGGTPSVCFRLDTLIVVVTQHSNIPNRFVITSAYHDDNLTGLTGGINPQLAFA